MVKVQCPTHPSRLACWPKPPQPKLWRPGVSVGETPQESPATPPKRDRNFARRHGKDQSNRANAAAGTLQLHPALPAPRSGRTTCAAVRRHWPRTKCELQRDAVCSLGSGKVFAAWLCSSLSGFCIWSWRSFLDVRAHTHTQRLGQQPGSGTSALPGITGCLLKGVLEFLTSSWM